MILLVKRSVFALNKVIFIVLIVGPDVSRVNVGDEVVGNELIFFSLTYLFSICSITHLFSVL